MFPISVCVITVTLAPVFGQTAQPLIQSIQNAASGTATAIAPQMLVAIFGQSLATSTASPPAGFPLPNQLAGTSVTFNGISAPLLYASPTQINAQVPTGVQSATQASVIVTTPAGRSDRISVAVQSSAIGIFTQDRTGCGQLSAFNVHADGSLSVNTPQNSLDPVNDWGLTTFLTGLGVFSDRVDGVPSQYNPADRAGIAAMFTTGLLQQSYLLQTAYSGPAPGQVGVDQVNTMLFPDSRNSYPQGCKVPLYFTDYPDSASQLVNVSVHRGGGACTDPPADSLGLITWQKNVVSNPVSSSGSDSLSIQFFESAGIEFPHLPIIGESSLANGPSPSQPSFCAASYPKMLDAGMLSVASPEGAFSLAPKTFDGILSYQSTLPAGSLQGGDISVISQNGGPGVGPFTSTAQIPPPISITTNLQPGTTVPRDRFLLNWTGGDSRSRVTVQYIVTSGGTATFTAVSTVSADNNLLLDLIFFNSGGFAGQNGAPPGDVEIIFTQQPSSVPSQPFNAPGLTLGGEQTWRYVFDFTGLKNQ
jgi:uncharacterized protein (TIGR03437 family)